MDVSLNVFRTIRSPLVAVQSPSVVTLCLSHHIMCILRRLVVLSLDSHYVSLCGCFDETLVSLCFQTVLGLVTLVNCG